MAKKHKHKGGKHADLMPRAKRLLGRIYTPLYAPALGSSHPGNAMDGTMPPCPGGGTPPGGGVPPAGGGV